MNHIITSTNTALNSSSPLVAALLLISVFSAGFIVGDIVSSSIKSKQQNEKTEVLVAEIAALRNVIESHFDTDSDDEEDELEEELPVTPASPLPETPPAETPLPETPPPETPLAAVEQKHHANDEKHAQLLAVLEEGSEVHITYKKETSTAIFVKDAQAPNGYWLRHQNEDYNTPSHFSTYIKKLTNPAIQADNGWDSLYIVQGTKANGKPIKCTLNTLINSE